MDLSTSVWRKSTFSQSNGCLEVAIQADGVALRDTKDRNGPILVFSRREWEAFIGGVRAGEFDLEP
jgi:hypothetical protein